MSRTLDRECKVVLVRRNGRGRLPAAVRESRRRVPKSRAIQARVRELAQTLRRRLEGGLARMAKAMKPCRWQLRPKTELAAVALVAAAIGAANLRWRAETAEVDAMSHELQQVRQAISTAQSDVEELQGLNDELRELNASVAKDAPATSEQEPTVGPTLPISVRRQRPVPDKPSAR